MLLERKKYLTIASVYCSLQEMLEKERKLNIASAQQVIQMKLGDAWEILCDLSLAHNYVPGVIDTVITTENKRGKGASRKVYQGKNRCIDETVEEWNEGNGFLIRLHRGNAGPPLPFERAWFRYTIEKDGADSTLITTSLIYVMKWGKLGQMLNKVIIGRFVLQRIRAIALSMKIYYETGEKVTPHTLKRAKKTA